jgi:hypothetical protein
MMNEKLDVSAQILGRFKIFLRLYVLLSMTILVSCEKQVNAPLSEEKFIQVLVDVHAAEALVQAESQVMRDSLSLGYFAQIFKRHGITQMDFDSTMNVYSREPIQFDSIYTRTERMVKRKRDSLTGNVAH